MKKSLKQLFIIICIGMSSCQTPIRDDISLREAAYIGDWHTVKHLLESGKDPNLSCPNGCTALKNASQENHSAIVKLLLRYKADPNLTDMHGRTALGFAVGNGNIACAKILIKNGANVKAREKDGWTPLHRAAYFGYVESVKLLLKHGADPMTKDDSGRLPIDMVIGKDATWGLKDSQVEKLVQLLKANANKKNTE